MSEQFEPKSIGESDRPVYDGVIGKTEESAPESEEPGHLAGQELIDTHQIIVLEEGTIEYPELGKGDIGYNPALDKNNTDVLAAKANNKFGNQ